MPGPYRIHVLGPGDERALQLLASGNGRFGQPGESGSKPPLDAGDAATFVNDDRTLCLVALEASSNRIAGFVYACVLYRRHTKLRHLCVYELGIDVDHRDGTVAKQLLEGLAGEARKRGITQGFVVTGAANSEAVAAYHAVGAAMVPDPLVMAFEF